uniref:Uncharacterized protein n=1 Tax=Oryzias melastigma TaxID=30732 RepID=A0A3B3BIJ0_ORYME
QLCIISPLPPVLVFPVQTCYNSSAFCSNFRLLMSKLSNTRGCTDSTVKVSTLRMVKVVCWSPT